MESFHVPRATYVTWFCYLVVNCLSSDGVFKFAIVEVSGLLMPGPLILLHFIHT